MNWLILTLLAVLSRSVYSLATKVLSENVKVSPISQSVLQSVFSGLLAIPFALAINQFSFANILSSWQPLLLIMIVVAFGNILYYQGIKWLDSGSTQVAFSSILIWGTLLSMFYLNSRFTIMQFVGIGLMLVAILMIQYQKKLVINKGVWLVIASAGLFAVFQVFSAKIASSVSTGAYLTLTYFGSSLVLAAVYPKILVKELILVSKQLRSAFKATLFASSTSLLYFIFAYFAYQVAPDRGIVVILLTAQVVVSVLFGIVFLKERQNMPKKLLAGVLAFIASILIKS